jgi:hypothetical protein
MAVELGKGWEATCKGAVRGALDAVTPEDPLRLLSLDVTSTYEHGLEESEVTGGTIGVAIGPAQISLNRSQDSRERSSGNLVIAARYERGEDAPTLTAVEVVKTDGG